MAIMSDSTSIQTALNNVLSELPKIESLEEQVKSLEEQVNNQQLLIYVSIGLIVVLMLTTFLFIKRLLKEQIETDKRQNARLAEIEKQINIRFKNANDDVNKLSEQMDILKQKQEKQSLMSQRQQVPTRESTGQQHANYSSFQTQQGIGGTSANTSTMPPQKMIKYFSLQEGQGSQLSVLERHLVDDESLAWFKMNINGNTASFEINPNATGSILSDIPQLHSYATPFDSVQNPTRVLTVRPGQMRKEGKSWIVTEKITVKLA